MSETTIQMASGIESDEFDNSGDHHTYDAPAVDDKPAKGFAFLASAAEQAGRFIEVTVSDDGDELELDKYTGATGKYATPGAAVRSIYFSHDVMEDLGGEETDDGFDCPEALGFSVAPSTEEAFEEAREEAEQSAENEADDLLGDVGGDDDVEVEEDEDDDEAEAEALLAEAEEAAE